MVGRHSSWRGRNDGSRHLCLHRHRGAQCWPCSGGRLHRGGTLCSSFCSLLHRVCCRGACGWRRFQLSSHHLRYACPVNSSPDSFCNLYWGLVASLLEAIFHNRFNSLCLFRRPVVLFSGGFIVPCVSLVICTSLVFVKI